MALATKTYQPGVYTSPKLLLSPTQSQITLTAARNNWPDTGADVLSISANASFDGGQTWSFLSGFTAPGGAIVNPWTGQTETASSFMIGIPQVGNANRMVQVIATVITAINASVSVTVN